MQACNSHLRLIVAPQGVVDAQPKNAVAWNMLGLCTASQGKINVWHSWDLCNYSITPIENLGAYNGIIVFELKINVNRIVLLRRRALSTTTRA